MLPILGFLIGCHGSFAQPGAPETVRVNVRVIEADTRRITPVMVCITHVKDARVHVPPAGEVAGAPAEPGPFFQGIEFNPDRNWVGPVRMMAGPGGV
ncbi:MAG: hypothetical protein H7Z75_17545, partial [Ferruginibacter sp.]|nr:hypothetical protein [Cytophagales bacterium]